MRKENCSKAIMKNRSVSSPSEPKFFKESSLTSQNTSNWSNASFLMLSLLCIHAQSLLKIHKICYQCPSQNNFAFCLEVGSTSVQYPSVVWHDIWGKHPLLLAKATFKLLCSMTEISQNLTWWQRLAPRFLPEGAWFPLASVFFPAVV